jgi:hypothetical protein
MVNRRRTRIQGALEEPEWREARREYVIVNKNELRHRLTTRKTPMMMGVMRSAYQAAPVLLKPQMRSRRSD